ncbi:hypothetical protein MXD62_19935 [Frankia sp. Mgl5]|uniref:hypothetical protein n=1 Tax=Frankia sp. Mgl5 TaxID=2933793 RepID=UPI00200F7F53|nr:hypothetical protein [Frankia sp. Mgl5]MCK9929422.1 hypothetical protein [Frankia sp. Mgl5]
MATALPLDETVSVGDTGHAQKHSDLAHYVNLIAALTDTDKEVAAATTKLLSVLLAGDLLARLVIRADGTIAMGGAPLTVSTVSGTSTVTVTTTANHGYGTADVVKIAGVAGHVGSNGTWTITRTGATTFTLNGAVGSGSYTSGGQVQRLLGTSGSANEGVWNFVVPEGENTRYGMVIRLNSSSLKSGLKVVDHQGSDILFVNPTGGFGLLSADPNDSISTATGTATTNRKGSLNSNGRLRIAGGDPGGGDGVLALGNAVTAPTSNPDGTHTVEGSYTTTAGTVAWSRGGRPRARTSVGHEDELLASVHRRELVVAATGSSTTLGSYGMATPTVATTNITAAVDNQAAGPMNSYTTTAASGVDAGVLSDFGRIQARWAPYFYGRIMTDASAVTSTRLAVGLVSAEIAADAGPASTGAYAVASGAWFRYATDVDGTAFWRTVTSDAANATVTTTTAAIAANTSYELIVEVNSAATSIRFWVNGTLVATHTANLPAATTALGYTARLRTLAASARALRFGRINLSAL